MRAARVWRNAEPFHVEFAEVAFGDETLRASGVAIAAEPMGYRLEYELSTSRGYVTRRLAARSSGAGWRRGIVLERSESGDWSCSAEAHGDADLPKPGLERAEAGLDVTERGMPGLEVPQRGLDLANPGLDLPLAGVDGAGALEGALDCDLGLSPLTNSMPLLRHLLHRRAGSVEFLMAWVAVPELAVYPSRQRYTFLRRTDDGTGAVVRFESLDSDFTADIRFDEYGLVVDYPGIGHAVPAIA